MFYKAGTSLKLILLALMIVAISFGCQKEKPAVGGQGELALSVPEGIELMPWHHMPLEKTKEHGVEVTKAGNIKANHMDLIKSGKVKEKGCLACHYEPDRFCNKCHEYVGVSSRFSGSNGKAVLMLEAPDGIPPPPNHEPIEKWRATHDRAIINGEMKISDCLGCHADPENFCNKCHVNAGLRKIEKP